MEIFKFWYYFPNLHSCKQKLRLLQNKNCKKSHFITPPINEAPTPYGCSVTVLNSLSNSDSHNAIALVGPYPVLGV